MERIKENAKRGIQADFVRNGNANKIMSLSKEKTTALWNAIQDSELSKSCQLVKSILVAFADLARLCACNR